MRRVEGDHVEQLPEFGVASLDVADNVVAHGRNGTRHAVKRHAVVRIDVILACPMKFPLNEPQRAAVRYLDGPLLVLAGAGSGKTRVITAKIAHLIERGFDPAHIAAITFTNKAAREMRERALRLLPKRDGAEVPIICTFHLAGPEDPADRGGGARARSAFDTRSGRHRGHRRRAAGDDRPARAHAPRSGGSAPGRTRWSHPAQALATASSDADIAAAHAYQRYDQTLRSYQAVDFDDLIAMPLASLERDGAAAERWRERLSYLLIDEYQDTNPVQYRLLKVLAGTRAAFTAVGDDDQAIYGWRGATIENLEQLPRDFDSLKVIKLEQNYRSDVRILRSANALIANNAKLYDKKLWSERGLGDLIRVVPAADEEAEAGRRRTPRCWRRSSSTTTHTRTSPSCIEATIRRARSSARCRRKTYPTSSAAASRGSSAPRSRTWSRTCG